ncbi:MAG: copper homeostasis protein CutC [Chitinophagales bacterium]|nr:copper homeostasis protein CutC [Chitinophagales bacterium]
MLLEVVVFNFRSALKAAEAGADRLELCDNFYEGGTTPSFGMISVLKETLNIPLFPMVRPRGGDFLYNDEEIKVMHSEIRVFKDLGCEGVVLGCLRPDGTVDADLLARFVEQAWPMEVTFHRAFDRVNDQLQAMKVIIDCGCKRILTSGGKPFANDGLEEISTLIRVADDEIVIIPGGGVNKSNIQKFMETGAIEFHAPALKMTSSRMKFVNKNMNEALESATIDEDEIKLMKQLLTQDIDRSDC